MATFKRTQRVSSRRSVPRLYVQAIFALAAALALTTSACGKKDEGAKPVAPASATPPAPPSANTAAIGTVAGTEQTGTDGKKAGTPVPPATPLKKQKRGQSVPRVDSTGPTAQTDENGNEADPLGDRLFPKTETEVPPVVETPEDIRSVVAYDPNLMTKDQMAAAKKEVIAKGAFFGELVRSDIMSPSNEALYYTGSGHDNLRDQLYTMVNARAALVDEQTREGDRELAETIQLSRFNIDWSNEGFGNAEFNFVLERINKHGDYVRTKVKMRGQIDNLNRFTVKGLNRDPYMSAEVVCMDRTGGCKTVHVRVQKNTKKGVQTAHMISRTTNSMLTFRISQPGTSRNSEYDRLATILQNTANNPAGENVIERLTMTTSETIGGASNFTVRADMRLFQAGLRGGDTFEITGPLVKPRNHDFPNVSVNISRALTVLGDQIVPTDAMGTDNRVADYVREARLTRNDGQGTLDFELTVRRATVDANEDKIMMRVERIHTPTKNATLSMQ